MDIKLAVSRLASDCDLRQRFVNHAPNIFDNYFVTKTGELVTGEELKIINSLRYFSDGLDLICGSLARL